MCIIRNKTLSLKVSCVDRIAHILLRFDRQCLMGDTMFLLMWFKPLCYFANFVVGGRLQFSCGRSKKEGLRYIAVRVLFLHSLRRIYSVSYGTLWLYAADWTAWVGKWYETEEIVSCTRRKTDSVCSWCDGVSLSSSGNQACSGLPQGMYLLHDSRGTPYNSDFNVMFRMLLYSIWCQPINSSFVCSVCRLVWATVEFVRQEVINDMWHCLDVSPVCVSLIILHKPNSLR